MSVQMYLEQMGLICLLKITKNDNVSLTLDLLLFFQPAILFHKTLSRVL